MLRRHAIGFRTLLMVADGLIAVVLLATLSVLRFGEEWLSHWQPILAEPAGFAFAYAAVWVAVLWLHGLYRPRSRWTLRSESLAIGRSVIVMALITFSLLFALRLPDVSRAFLEAEAGIAEIFGAPVIDPQGKMVSITSIGPRPSRSRAVTRDTIWWTVG